MGHLNSLIIKFKINRISNIIICLHATFKCYWTHGLELIVRIARHFFESFKGLHVWVIHRLVLLIKDHSERAIWNRTFNINGTLDLLEWEGLIHMRLFMHGFPCLVSNKHLLIDNILQEALIKVVCGMLAFEFPMNKVKKDWFLHLNLVLLVNDSQKNDH